MTDTGKSLGQDVQQIAAHELRPGKAYRLGLVAIAVVFVTDHDAVFIDGEDTGVGDGDPVGVTAEVVEHRAGVVEAGFGVDHPGCCHQFIKHPVDLWGIGEAAQFAFVGAFSQGADHAAPEVARERFDREQVVALGGLPLPLCVQGAARYQGVQVNVLAEVLAPGVTCMDALMPRAQDAQERCSTAVMPSCPFRRLGSSPKALSVAQAHWNSRR